MTAKVDDGDGKKNQEFHDLTATTRIVGFLASSNPSPVLSGHLLGANAETEESPVGMLGRQEILLTSAMGRNTVAPTNKD